MTKRTFPKVYLASAAVSPPARSVSHLTWRQFIAQAAQAALDRAGLSVKDVDIGAISYNERTITEGALGCVAADAIGMIPRPFVSISQACCGGGLCTDVVWNYIASGRYKAGIVLGISKPDNFDFRDAMGPIGNYTEYDYMLGFSHENYGALRSESYKKRFGYGEEAAAAWAKQCYWYGRRNDSALRKLDPSDEELMADDTAGYRLRTATGRNLASCLILVSEEVVEERKLPRLLLDVSYRTRPPYLGNHYDYAGHEAFADADPATQPGLRLAAEETLARACVTPSDIQLAQVHDLSPFEGMEALEGMGIIPVGSGGKFAMEGGTGLGGRCPTNTDGGAISYGHSSAGGDFSS
ncbi:MAG: thiolase family protein, partial [Spirochaetes bacterium]|nr:thiolase family protein [Spirochaetota bacterium]